MYVFRLFHRDRPFEQLDARMLQEGEIVVGRDPEVDWPLVDPECTVSRRHGVFTARGGLLTFCDNSSNGSFTKDGRRLPNGSPVVIETPQILHLGQIALLVEKAVEEVFGHDAEHTQLHVPISAVSDRPLIDWCDAPADAENTTTFTAGEKSPIEAFCDGANLDASSLCAADPAELMKRLGEIYQQTLLGLSLLVTARAAEKREQGFDRTTIDPIDNNPFKWAPSRRLAVELLFDRQDGFMTGAEAIRASFEDISTHINGVRQGANEALIALLAAVSPTEIELAIETKSFSLQTKATQYRNAHRRKHADTAQLDHVIKAAFHHGYLAEHGKGNL